MDEIERLLRRVRGMSILHHWASKEQIEAFENEIGQALPDDVVMMLSAFDGGTMIDGAITLYGIGELNDVVIKDASWDIPEISNSFIIGELIDGTKLCITKDTPNFIYEWDQGVANVWINLEECLCDLIRRYRK